VAQKANLSFKNRFPYTSVIDEASDFKYGMQLQGLPKPIIKSHYKKKTGCGPGLGEFPEIWGFLSNITATAKAGDFKFGLPKPIIK